MYKIIAIGDLIVDTLVKIDDASLECDVDGRKCKLLLDYASKIPVTDSFQTVGGNAANVTFGTSILGLESAVLSTTGDDSNSRLIIDELEKSGIGIENIYKDKKSQTRYSIVLNFKGERTILSYHKKRNYKWPTNFPETEWIYYTSLSDGFEPLQKKLSSFLNNHASIHLAFNPGSFQIKNNLNLVREIIPQCDLLIVNLEEAEIISSTTYKKSKTVSGLINKLLQLGAKEVVITDAANGAWAGNMDEIWHMDAYEVPIVSKTGAGDAFSAGYMAAKIYGHSLAKCLNWGITNSCAVLGHYGVKNGLLKKIEIQKLSDKFSKIKPQQI